jgi:hypothetical protein
VVIEIAITVQISRNSTVFEIKAANGKVFHRFTALKQQFSDIST